MNERVCDTRLAQAGSTGWQHTRIGQDVGANAELVSGHGEANSTAPFDLQFRSFHIHGLILSKSDRIIPQMHVSERFIGELGPPLCALFRQAWSSVGGAALRCGKGF